MPLTRHIGVVARVFQQGRHGYHVISQHPLIVGVHPLLRGKHFRNIGYPCQMAIYPGEQHGSGWSAISCGVVVGKAHTLLRQCTQAWCIHLAAVGRDIGIAQIIGEDEHDVGA